MWLHISAFFFCIMTKTEDACSLCNLDEANIKMLFYTAHLVAPNNKVAGKADTAVIVIALANVEKLD